MNQATVNATRSPHRPAMSSSEMGARSEDRFAYAQSYSAAESTNRCGFEDDPSTTA